MLRLFIALPVETAVQQFLSETIAQLRARGGSVKWVDPKNMHLTVKFLGDTDEKLVEQIAGKIDKIASRNRPIHCTLDRLGAFPNLRRPRVFWAGMSSAEGDMDTLKHMAGAVDLAVSKLGFERESRPFKSHLTLGRVRTPSGLEALTGYMETLQIKPCPVHLDRLVLFKSTLTPKGPIYDRLHEAALGEQRFEG
jgi:2'-5' RNA ligase